jgi:hypothetical protein
MQAHHSFDWNSWFTSICNSFIWKLFLSYQHFRPNSKNLKWNSKSQNFVTFFSVYSNSMSGFQGLCILHNDTTKQTLSLSSPFMFFLVFETYSSIQSCSLVQNYSDKTISTIQIPGKFLVSKVKSLGISPGFDYRSLQNGNSVQCNGVTTKPEDAIGPSIPDHKLLVVDFREINSFLTLILICCSFYSTKNLI